MAQSITQLEAELVSAQEAVTLAQRRLAEAEQEAELAKSLPDLLAGLTYDTQTAEGMTVRGCKNPCTVPEGTYDVGTARLPMAAYRRARVLDFTPYLIPGVFRARGRTLYEQVQTYLEDKWDDVASYDLYVLPINAEARRQGRAKCDLPNVTFALVTQMLLRGLSVVIVDPAHKGTDDSVSVVDLSRVLRGLEDKRCKVAVPYSAVARDDAVSLVVYQRGSGTPSPQVEAQLCAATGLARDSILHVHLVPGKYEQGKGTWGGHCHRDFTKGAAQILHELAVVTPFVDAQKKRSLHALHFVLDEFSGYAMYTAVAVLGYDVLRVASLLAYHKGEYTLNRLVPP